MCVSVNGYALVCVGVLGWAWVCVKVFRCVHIHMGVHRYGCGGGCEYLLETRVLTSADFNTYPIQIFSMIFAVKKSLDCRVLIEIVLAVICKNLCQ